MFVSYFNYIGNGYLFYLKLNFVSIVGIYIEYMLDCFVDVMVMFDVNYEYIMLEMILIWFVVRFGFIIVCVLVLLCILD